MLTVEEASQRIRAALPAVETEEIEITEADGRALASALVARRALPPWDNSAMDGFAVRAAELPGELPIAGTIAAGDAPERTLDPGTVLRIMTGAPMPEGADAVVMREVVDDRGETAVFEKAAGVGDNVRRRGEDVDEGDEIVAAGTRLGPGEIGMLAAQGYARLQVGRRPRVALLSTGDELVDVDVEPEPGQIVNSNAYALAAQVREAGGVPIEAGIAPDDRDALPGALRAALESADVLVTSGGVSVGDFDFVKEAFAEVGVDMDFWKVAMKPGKPLAFGSGAAGKPVFGLPGNPVSSMVSFELFVRPALMAMQGASQIERPRTRVVMSQAYGHKAGRAHFVRVMLSRREDGRLEARPHPRQGSGMLSSMIGIDGLVIVPADAGVIGPGDQLDAMLLRPV